MRACSANQVMTGVTNPLLSRPLIQCWKWLAVSRSAVSVWGEPHPSLPRRLFSAPLLSLSSLSCSLAHSFTQTQAQHTPLPRAVQTLGEEPGRGSLLTPDELAMGMTSPWPRCSPTQPMPTVLKKKHFQVWINNPPRSTYLTPSHCAFSTRWCASEY